MTIEKFDNLIKRIKTEPSVLFLGQKYLSSFNGHDVFYETICRKISPESEQALAPPECGWLWNIVGNEGRMDAEAWTALSEVLLEIPEQKWLRQMLSMRWGLIYTSAVEDALTQCVGGDFSISTIGYDKKQFRREYMDKRSLHGIFLYGSVSGGNGEFPPEICDEKRMRSFRKRVRDRIAWIYNDILRDYGILVIDGWQPDADWASFLLDDASDMPFGSIYLFGISNEQAQGAAIRYLVEDGIACVEAKTFPQLLQEYGYFEDEETADGNSIIDGDKYKTITISGNKNREIYYDIPQSALESLDSRIILVHDQLGKSCTDYGKPEEAFSRFLQQGEEPIWPLFHERCGFYFKRDVDKVLEDTIQKEFKKKDSYHHRRIILLEGVSNSGKTTTLAKCALKLRDGHRCPVLYISGQPTQTNYIEKIKIFSKHYFGQNQGREGEGAQSIVIIWDNNRESDAVKLYVQMAKELMECNPIIIGSIYGKADGKKAAYVDKRGIDHIPVDALLSETEVQALKKVLERVDGKLLKILEKTIARNRRKSASDSAYMLDLLQAVAKYSYSSEWKAVAELLSRRYKQEVNYSEEIARKAVDGYNEKISLEDVREQIYTRGIGSAWQIKLQLVWEAHGFQCTRDVEREGSEEQKKLLQLKTDITQVNEILAVAGQFSVALPVTLLLRILHGGKSVLLREDLFIDDVLRNDNLVRYYVDEQGYPKVCFRHPTEASIYLSKNWGVDDEELREKEVAILCNIIRNGRWSEDSYEILSLVRKFSSNSDGKFNQNIRKGHYGDYARWWVKIAECLKEYASEVPECVLVYAHFMRDAYTNELREGKEDQRLLEEAANELRITIENHSRNNQNQYCRLLVEVCSNLVASMDREIRSEKFEVDTFSEFQNKFKQAVSNWRVRDNYGYFTTNSLLDIELNAIRHFRRSFHNVKEAFQNEMFARAFSDAVSYIDALLDLDGEIESPDFLDKIEEVFSWHAIGMDSIRDSLDRRSRDTFLYLEAGRCWITKNSNVGASRELWDIVQHNTFLLPDDADKHDQLRDHLQELKKWARDSASKAIKVLEGSRDLIRKSKSGRCLYMLIKAKWLVYTGDLLLAEKQTPALTEAQWNELYKLCDDCVQYTSLDSRVKPAVYMILGVYLWTYTNRIGEARDYFNNMRQNIGSEWFIERIGLFDVDAKKMRQFYVDVRKNSSGNFEATIKKEVTTSNAAVKKFSLAGRNGIHISDRVLSYLFEGQMPHEKYNIQKAVTIWFNARGASLGLPKDGKGGVTP